METTKMFRLQNQAGEDVLGGAVSEDNVYIKTYGAVPDADYQVDAKGEFYVDLDEETGLYCVFGSETGHAYASFSDLTEAKKFAVDFGNPRAGSRVS